MGDLLILVFHLVTTVFRLARPGGLRAVVAESVLAKHQLLILNRSCRRCPNLRVLDRIIAAFCSLWIKPRRFVRVAIVFKPSTLLNFHRVLVQRSIASCFPRSRKPSPVRKGPTADLIRALSRRNSAIRPGDVRVSPNRSIWRLGPLLIRMWSDAFWSSITGRYRPKVAHPG